MTTLDALKALFVSLGGDPDDFTANTNAEAVAAASGELLTALGGINEPLICTFTEDGGVVTCDKTVAEIGAAVAAGKEAYAVLPNSAAKVPLTYINYDASGDVTTLVFSAPSFAADGSVNTLDQIAYASGAWTYTSI